MTVQAPDPSRHDGGLLCVQLSIIDLDAVHSYSTLSYVWGKPNPSCGDTDIPAVFCGEYIIPVTPNCHSALVHLRRMLGQFTIWTQPTVDAICINQNDEQEKLQQIPLMDEIYSRAHATYVWLGEGDNDTGKTMQ
ncbi:hypothetical protein M011DRAFT_403678 [Sporormia fimetaria CBS 119925]|uniref:Heterokaryon incompatibility domain-containing protein n=1 Tax=Sporormia fimetaria CBS 119925 TaxID=1340428 RepID=A0A6A6VCR7_9PLEO|nr:hypothetical protein M011DRAFT_403678 [Sporormia fimetaria CBS 119925]